MNSNFVNIFKLSFGFTFSFFKLLYDTDILFIRREIEMDKILIVISQIEHRIKWMYHLLLIARLWNNRLSSLASKRKDINSLNIDCNKVICLFNIISWDLRFPKLETLMSEYCRHFINRYIKNHYCKGVHVNCLITY